MATFTLDTHDFVKGLTDAGLPEQQAEAIAEGFGKLNLEHVATKSDVGDLRVELRDIKIELLKWMIPLMLGQVVSFAAIVAWITS